MENSSKKILKKVLIICGGIISVPVLFLAFSYVYTEIQFELVVKKKIAHLPAQYQQFANNCIAPLPTDAQWEQQACCLESLEQMYRGGYTLAPLAFSDDPTRGCGFSYSKLRCDRSLEWCEEGNTRIPENLVVRSALGEVKKTELFSIPSSSKILSHCPECEEKGIDSIEGQNWWFAVSQDHRRYAYVASKNTKSFVVLDGVKQKSYDRVFFLKFSPNGESFSYHAYDEARDQTFLVLNGKEILVYPGDEGYPQAANGVSEAYGRDDQFAYARVAADAPEKMEIYKNNQLINTVEGELIKLWFSESGRELEYVVLDRSVEGKDRYYIDNELKNDAVEYNDYLDLGNKITLKGKEVIISEDSKAVSVNGTQIKNYQESTPEVYLSSLVASPNGKDIAYKVWANTLPGWQKVSLNGNDSDEVFNDIRDIRFDPEAKLLRYIAREGRIVYLVEQPVVIPQTTPITTSSWKTYTNDKYRFSLKYPMSWSVNEIDGVSTFFLKSEKFIPILLGYDAEDNELLSRGEIIVEVSDNPKKLDIQSRYSQFDDMPRTYFSNPKIKYTKIKINGREVVVFESFNHGPDFSIFHSAKNEDGSTVSADLSHPSYKVWHKIIIVNLGEHIVSFDYTYTDNLDEEVLRILPEIVNTLSIEG